MWIISEMSPQHHVRSMWKKQLWLLGRKCCARPGPPSFSRVSLNLCTCQGGVSKGGWERYQRDHNNNSAACHATANPILVGGKDKGSGWSNEGAEEEVEVGGGGGGGGGEGGREIATPPARWRCGAGGTGHRQS